MCIRARVRGVCSYVQCNTYLEKPIPLSHKAVECRRSEVNCVAGGRTRGDERREDEDLHNDV